MYFIIIPSVTLATLTIAGKKSLKPLKRNKKHMQTWLNAFLTRSDLTSRVDGHCVNGWSGVLPHSFGAKQLGQRSENEKEEQGGMVGKVVLCGLIWPEHKDEISGPLLLSSWVRGKKEDYDVYAMSENMVTEIERHKNLILLGIMFQRKELWQN